MIWLWALTPSKSEFCWVHMRLVRVILLILLFALLLGSAYAQQACQPPALSRSELPNMFNDEQEMMLGDVFAEHFRGSWKLIEEDELTGLLRTIGSRLGRQLPAHNLRLQFFLLDAPYANAFTIPGGRVYVTRKLISTTRTEDELAGVLAHELGHVVTRQPEQEVTRLWRAVLGVTSVADRADIEEKYNQFLDSYREKPDAFRGSGKHDAEQGVADQVALYAMARAGYSPQALSEFFDRFTEMKGKTGSWLSDLFGTTKPESKRLREMVKNLAAIPPMCIDQTQRANAQEFQKWRSAILTYTGTGRTERVHHVVMRRPLNPWLEDEVTRLKFSPDGNFVLAQDEASIFVLSRQPFTTLFRIDAPDASPAQFTPDSKSVIFATKGLRVEKWSIHDRQIQQANEVYIRRGCLQSRLSPDGNVLACLQPQQEFRDLASAFSYAFIPGVRCDLVLYDIETGKAWLAKKDFLGLSVYSLELWVLSAGRRPIINMAFSPDAHYALLGISDSQVAVDLTTKSEIHLTGAVKRLTRLTYAFLGPDRLVGLDAGHPEKSGVVRFPSGEVVVDMLPMGRQLLEGATHGDTVLMRPIRNYAVGAMDLKTKKIFAGNKSPAFDLYDSAVVGEAPNGDLLLFRTVDDKNPQVQRLPRPPLGALRATALSADSNMLAISDRERGAVWDMNTGERLMHVRAFRGAWFDSPGQMYITYPPMSSQFKHDLATPDAEGDDSKKDDKKTGKTENVPTVWKVDLKTRAERAVSSADPLERLTQAGPYLLVRRRVDKKTGYGPVDETLEIKRMTSDTPLWSRRYRKGGPSAFLDPRSGSILFLWRLSQEGAMELVESDKVLQSQVEAINKAKYSYLIEVLEIETGKRRAAFAIDTRSQSFTISRASAAGNTVIVSDSNRRTLVYSLDGHPKGRVFGEHAVLSPDGGALAVEDAPGQVIVYDLATLRRRDEFTFEYPASMISFNQDGKRLAVLTADQIFFLLEPQTLPGAAGSAH